MAANDRDAILGATESLLSRVMSANGAQPEDLVSILFTATPDLDAVFPAVAARRLGLGDVPLLCASEIAVEGAPERIVRILIHLYSERDAASLEHVYEGDARRLRNEPTG